MIGLAVEVSGDPVEGLDALDTQLRDFTPAFEQIAATLRVKIGREQFESGGAARGTPWAERKNPAPGRILERTGSLRESFESEASPHHVEAVGPHSMVWGSSHPLAHVHQEGSVRRKRGRLPARLIVTFRSDEEKERIIFDPIREHL